jgi:hypothetical protein
VSQQPRSTDRSRAVEANSSVIAALSRHEGEFLRRFGATPARTYVLNRLLACRTGALGGHLLACGPCKLTLPVYKSCDNRHCPQCGTARAAKWLEERLGRMLPVPHFQVVFTLPAQLRAVAHDNPKLVYALMFRVGASVLTDLAEQRLDARVGITSVLHTWASNLSLHPHVHCLVTAGGLRLDGEAWVPTSSKFLFPVAIIARMYRGRLLEALIEGHNAGQLRLRGDDPEQARADFEGMLRHISKRYRQWGVHVEAPEGRSVAHAVKYLARYVYRVAISNRRIVSVTDTHVSFRARDSESDGKQRVLRLEGPEFVRRFLQHVLSKGFRKVRHFGLYAPGAAAQKLARAHELVPAAAEEGPSELEKEAALMVCERLLTAHDLYARRCPGCGERMATQPLSHSFTATARGSP